MNTLDELFKEKLSDYPVTPSADSWQKVEASLTKKNNSIAWRWAAVFLIGVVAGSLWLVNSTPPSTLVIQKEVPLQKTAPEIKTPLASVPEKTNVPIATVGRKRTPDSVKLDATPIEENVHPVQGESIGEVAQAKAKEAELPVAVPEVTRSIVLTYTLGPVETTSNDDVLASEKKDHSLRRVVDFAKNVKNSDSPIGGLRVMKEDLFALDLKKKATSKNH